LYLELPLLTRTWVCDTLVIDSIPVAECVGEDGEFHLGVPTLIMVIPN
jgi:hypothetical protein